LGAREGRVTPLPDIGPFRCERELGRGGMGVVYQAYDSEAGRRVAIKVPTGPVDAQRLARLRREAELSARLNHSGIVRIYSVGELPGGGCYLVYELIEGARSLADDWKSPGPWRRRVLQVLEVARAVAYAHEHGVVHRDLKPENVLLDAQGNLRVTDFGLATGIDLERLTQTRITVGTPSYMSPEGMRRAGTEPTIDVWSLGVLLYQAATGKLPFDGDTIQQLVDAVHSPPIPLRRVSSEVPPAIEAVCLRALALQPEDRLPNAEAFATELAAALVGGEVSSRVGERLAASAAILAVIVAIGLTLFVSLGKSAKSELAKPQLAQGLLEWTPAPSSEEVEQARGRLDAAGEPSVRALLLQELALAEALAALEKGDAEATRQRLAELAPGPAAILRARVAQELGEEVDLAPWVDAADLRVRTAARVLLARAKRSRDPAAAASLLEGLEGEGPARERQALALFAAIAERDAQAVTRLAEDSAQEAHLDEARQAVDDALAVGAASAHDLAGLEAATVGLAALRGPLSKRSWDPSTGADAVLSRLRSLTLAALPTKGLKTDEKPSQKVRAQATNVVNILEALAQAQVSPAQRLGGELAADALRDGFLQLSLETLRGRAVVAQLNLGIDLTLSHISLLRRSSVPGSGPTTTYLRSWTRLAHGTLPKGLRQFDLEKGEEERLRGRLRRLSLERGLPPQCRALALLLATKFPTSELARRACEQDPLSPWRHMALVSALLREQRKGSAMIEAQRTFELAEALQLRPRFATLSWQTGFLYSGLLRTYVRAGSREDAETLAALLRSSIVEKYKDAENSRLARASHALSFRIKRILEGKDR
jgi:predicted Ser/Thr protein kinase